MLAVRRRVVIGETTRRHVNEIAETVIEYLWSLRSLTWRGTFVQSVEVKLTLHSSPGVLEVRAKLSGGHVDCRYCGCGYRLSMVSAQLCSAQ